MSNPTANRMYETEYRAIANKLQAKRDRLEKQYKAQPCGSDTESAIAVKLRAVSNEASALYAGYMSGTAVSRIAPQVTKMAVTLPKWN